MANWRRSLVNAFWALDRTLGGQRRPDRIQKWVGRHPIKAGLPPALFFALFFWLVSDEEEPNNLLFAMVGGLVVGLIFCLVAVTERLRQRRLKRLGIWGGC
ncbi:hypothetical protein ACFUN7_25110 [Streptomyces sp. NPDC057236]|uniref:hypothetical protein n=1 Tax=Streptomyces sp. NPDC057236 TaxID=3346059 RepID=UPI003641B251